MFEKIFKKRRRLLITNHIQENNLIAPDKSKPLKGEIISTNCRGYNTIFYSIFFVLKLLQAAAAHTFTFKKLRL